MPLIYHSATDAIADVEEADIRIREADGWQKIDRQDVVAVYHPELNLHKTVLRATMASWVARGYYAEPTYVYHPDGQSRMVSKDEAEHLSQNGWYDTPAKFPNQATTEQLVEAAVKASKAKKD